MTYRPEDEVASESDDNTTYRLLKNAAGGRAMALQPNHLLSENAHGMSTGSTNDNGSTATSESVKKNTKSVPRFVAPRSLDDYMPAKQKSKRTLEKEQKGRLAIVSRDTGTQYVKKVVEKSDEEKEMIREAIATNILFKACSEEELGELVEVFAPSEATAGSTIIKEGDEGDGFFFMERGTVDVYEGGVHKVTLYSGVTFGEIALLYGCPRSATIRARYFCKLWSISRMAFRAITSDFKRRRMNEKVDFLNKVKIRDKSFSELLSDSEISTLALACLTETYEPGQAIVREGEPGDIFYMIDSGSVDVYIKAKGSSPVVTLQSGNFFGELALLSSDVRTASCIAKTKVKCHILMRNDFDLLLGDLQSMLDGNDYKRREEYLAAQPREAVKLVPKVKLSDLDVGKVLGVGAFGRVRLVKLKHPIDGIQEDGFFALKCISKNGLMSHILNEKSIMAGLDHPFINRFYCDLDDDKYIYFLLEALTGGELCNRLREEEKFSESWGKFYSASVLFALCHMHAKKIAYRDLKPENLVMDSTGYVKVVDFGLAKVIKGGKTWTLCGTPAYLAPELVLNDGHDWAVDYWALGVLLFEMTSGLEPFAAKNPMEVYKQIVSGNVNMPSIFSSTLSDLIRKLLHVSKSKRLGRTMGGGGAVMQHRWYSDYDFDAHLKKRLTPPLKPKKQYLSLRREIMTSQPDDESESGVSSGRPKFVAPQSFDDYDEEIAAAATAAPAGEVTMQEKQSLMSPLDKSTRRFSTIQRIPLAEKEDFTETEHNDKKMIRIRWYHALFLFSTASLIVCLLQLFSGPPFGVWMTSSEIEEIGVAPDGCEEGLEYCICPRETLCATNTYSIVLLTLARCSAFFDYPLYMMLFLSKCHNINNICRRTVLREWIDFADMHKVHKLFGVVVGIETMSHSFFHLLRWGLNGDISLLWETKTGITGLITAIITPLVCWPMYVPALKKNMKFELRKGLHYLAVVWAMALLWHAPSKIYYLIGIPALIYAVDYLFGFFIRNTLIENAYFERYGETGVALRFKNPKKWGSEMPKTSYLYIMCPFVSKSEWHAFTMFPEPTQDNHTMLCIGASGDWTKKLHDKIQVPCYKPLYVLGPYLSEFSDKAVTTSNAIAVASGIGITPTLSLMLNYAGKKRVNIIWMCRDAGLVEYILHKVKIEEITKNSYAFIYYTGKRELALPKHLPVNLFIFECRPNLEESVAGIITSINSGENLPEELFDSQLKIANVPLRKRMQFALRRVVEIYGADKMFEYAVEQTQKEMFRQHSAIESDFMDAACHIPDDAVSLAGLDAMIAEFCGGIGEYSPEDLEEVFDLIDSGGGTGFIDREDYDAFLLTLTNKSSTRLSTKSIELAATIDRVLVKSIYTKSKHGSKLHKTYSRGSMQESVNLMKTMIAESGNNDFVRDWSIFYCGGSNAIKKSLQDISKRYSLSFAVEKFDW